MILDYDAAGNVAGLEILGASKRLDNPHEVDYAVTAGSVARSRDVQSS